MRVAQRKKVRVVAAWKEFRELRLDRRVAYVGVALALLGMLAGNFAGGLFLAWFVIIINMYMFQGLAVDRRRVGQATW